MNDKLVLKGIIPPIITPLNADGDVDEEAVERLIDFQLRSGVSGIFIMGSSGEGPWLDTAQRETLLRASVRAIDGRVPLLAGAMEPVASRVRERLPQLQEMGVDAAVVATPYYFQADEAVQCAHFAAVAADSPLPIVLYNIPSMTHNVLAVEAVRHALQHESVIGIKDSGGDPTLFAQLLALREIRPDFQVLQGAEAQSAWALREGADGLVPGFANLIPGPYRRLYGDPQNDAMQQLAIDLGAMRRHGFFLNTLKYAMALCGFGCGRCVCRPDTLSRSAKTDIQRMVATHAPEALACAPF
ncbi:MAG: dihydrodipicolinate synthase family protein [Anaerolineaceae bacterium]|nr:dihydrodipicolinate synthase family protein [Anaerolineaceae bacterium]